MVGQWFEFGLVVICIHIKELLQSQTPNFGKTNMQTLSSEISGTSTQQPRSIQSMKNSQADLDAGMEAALCKGDYKASTLQQSVNSLIGSTSCLGRRMRVLCERYHFVIAPITVNASNEDCVLGVFMLHFFTHNERHRLRIEWGGMRSQLVLSCANLTQAGGLTTVGILYDAHSSRHMGVSTTNCDARIRQWTRWQTHLC